MLLRIISQQKKIPEVFQQDQAEGSILVDLDLVIEEQQQQAMNQHNNK